MALVAVVARRQTGGVEAQLCLTSAQRTQAQDADGHTIVTGARSRPHRFTAAFLLHTGAL